jgi:hypothetical protein
VEVARAPGGTDGLRHSRRLSRSKASGSGGLVSSCGSGGGGG